VLIEEIRNVEERIAFQPHVHERGLHSGQNARNAALMDAACQRIFIGALEVNLNQLVVFE
jgi:hypothetical protein